MTRGPEVRLGRNVADTRALLRIPAAAVFCIAAWLYVSPYYPAINNPNENVRFYMTAALVEEGRYEIDTLRQRWGWVNDAAAFGGHYYSVKAPGTSLLGVPGYALYHALSGGEVDRDVALYVCRLTGTLLPNALFVIAFALWLRRRTEHAGLADAITVSVFLGSLLYGYALLFVSHTTSASAAFGAFMLLVAAREGESTPARALLAGFLTAAVTALEYPGLVVSVGLSVQAIMTLRRLRPLSWFALGGLIPTLAVMHFQWKAFGNPLRPGHLYVETDALRAAHHEGIYGATSFHPDAALTLLFDPGSGLFVLTPLLVLGVIGLVVLIRRRPSRLEALTALAVTVLTYLAICFMNNWRGGWTIGPRYLAVVVPFLGWAALPTLSIIAARSRPLAYALASGTTLAGVVLSGIPSTYYPHLPPEITRPIPELFTLLIAHSFAPYNALNLLDVYGTSSMLPLFVLLVVASLLPIARLARGEGLGAGSLALMGAVGVGASIVLVAARPVDRTPEVKRAVAFITERWAPRGYDDAAELEVALESGRNPSAARYRALADLYFEEGRDDLATKAIARGRQAANEGGGSR